MKELLTIEKLKAMTPGEVFAHGECLASKWLACRGDIHDWAIYFGTFEWEWDYVKTNGDKICDRNLIKFLVPCDKEALEMYRD
jgi:hypothetical protein